MRKGYIDAVVCLVLYAAFGGFSLVEKFFTGRWAKLPEQGEEDD